MVEQRRKKPKHVVAAERERKQSGPETVWMFGLHAVREALENPKRVKKRLIVTKNAQDKLADAIGAAKIEPEIADPRKFSAPLDPQSVHQGAALEVAPLDWGSMSEVCQIKGEAPRVLLLDRVSDPHNVGAILRSAEVFGARAVIAPHRHSAPETGALAKAASGALERQPYLRVKNLARAMTGLADMGYTILGLDGEAEATLEDALFVHGNNPLAIVLGSEGPGLRHLTKEHCTELVKIPFASDFGSLNVSNAAAVALFASRKGS